MNHFKVLSPFDGMACAYIALTEEGHIIDKYVAYEIDEYAIKTSTNNIPMIEHRGDVFDANFNEFANFDWVMFGFPCTKFSVAQKKDREVQPYSGLGWDLFIQGWRAVKEVKPKYFLIENNYSMAKPVQDEISRIIGFEPIMIDAAKLSAQTRKRIYWCGIRQPDGTYGKANIPQPEDNGLLLKDVLDYNFKELSEKEINYMVGDTKGKYSDRWTYLQKPGEKDKACCLTANIHKGVPYNIVAQPVECIQVGALPRPDGELSTSQGFRIYAIEGKSVTLKGNAGGAGGKTGLYAIPVEFDGEIPAEASCMSEGKTYNVYEVKDKKITVKGRQYPIKLVDGFYIIRKLTVDECKRLQGIPDWYDMTAVSTTRALQQLGNGWCVPVIQHLIKYMIAEG